MDNNKFAELLFPHIKGTPEDIEAAFPRRELPEGAKVTRIAPSPTGFMHFGTLFPARIAERLAHQSGGVFYLRIEDTDSKREVKGAEKDIIDTINMLSERLPLKDSNAAWYIDELLDRPDEIAIQYIVIFQLLLKLH